MGVPITWQGWALTLAYLTAVFGAVFSFHDRPLQLIAVFIPATAVFLVIAARTTRGGWHWRWGGKEE